MKKTFEMENELGLNMTYTVLGLDSSGKDKFVIYTNYLPSDNELGVRLFAGKVSCDNPFTVEKVAEKKQKELIEAFKVEIISSGKKIRRVLNK